jgi:hypothetical protein
MHYYQVAHKPTEDITEWTREDFPTRKLAFDRAGKLKQDHPRGVVQVWERDEEAGRFDLLTTLEPIHD